MSESRVYQVMMIDEQSSYMVGIYTNRKILFDKLSEIIDLNKLYVLSKTGKHVPVNPANIGLSLESDSGLTNIYDNQDNVFFKIGEILTNNTNKKLNKYLDIRLNKLN